MNSHELVDRYSGALDLRRSIGWHTTKPTTSPMIAKGATSIPAPPISSKASIAEVKGNRPRAVNVAAMSAHQGTCPELPSPKVLSGSGAVRRVSVLHAVRSCTFPATGVDVFGVHDAVTVALFG